MTFAYSLFVDFKSTRNVMDIQLNQPKINVYQTPKGVLVQGHLPQVDDLDADIQETSVTLQGNHPQGPFQEQIPLQQPINPQATILTYHDHQLRMVLPWRTEQ